MTDSSKERPLRAIAGSADKPLIIGGLQIPCYVLEDETRVVGMREMTALGLGLYRGRRQYADHSDVELPGFVRQNWLYPSINEDLQAALNSVIVFQTPKGNIAHGYPASILVKLCHAAIHDVGPNGAHNAAPGEYCAAGNGHHYGGCSNNH